MNSRTASYCEISAAASPRSPLGRFSFSRSDRARRSRGTGRPGTGYSCSPGHAEGRPARRDDRQPLAGSQEVRDDRRARRSPARSCRARAGRGDPASHSTRRSRGAHRAGGLDEAERAGDPRRDERRVPDRLERHEPDAVAELVGDVGRELEREPRSCRSRPGPVSVRRRVVASRRRRLAQAPPRARRSSSAGSAGCSAGGRATGSAGSRPAARR